MKKFLSALLALALLMGAALAEGESPLNEAEETAAVSMEAEPAAKEAPAAETAVAKEAPSAETAAAKEAPAAEEVPTAETEPVAMPGADEENSAPVDDMMFPEGEEPFVMPVPTTPAPAEGYTLNGGERVSGTLAELLAEAGEKTVYVSAKESVEIKDFRLALLKGVTLLPDPDVFGKDCVVVLTCEGGAIAPEDIEAAKDEVVRLTISVEKVEKDPDPGQKEPEDNHPEKPEVALKVTPRNYADGAWQCEEPGFLLEGIPAAAAGYSYAAIIYDERIVPLSGDEYFAREEGEYAVRFAALDELGDIADKSDRYEIRVDLTAPELAIMISADRDYTMTLSAADSLSGVVALSLDGGETWVPLGEGESVVHTESRKKVFAPGMIQVRDAAGNVTANPEEITLAAIPKAPSMGGWGGMGGGDGGSSAPAAPHASGDGNASPYDAYALSLPEGAVEVLTMGGEALELGLTLDGEEFPAAEPALFTAELTAWAAENVPDASYQPPKNTLVVRAETGDVAGPYECTWRINGAVLRKLYNSEISYLALEAGDSMLSLPTVGFTAGTRYAELKMEGVSTAEFAYEIVMRVDPAAAGADSAAEDWNMAKGCAAELYVEVAGERFDMVDRLTTPEMYPFDVYCGPLDLPDYPYGAYPGTKGEE